MSKAYFNPTDVSIDRATQAVRNQTMGHRNSRTFQEYLIERVRFDVQAAFLERPSRDAIMRITGHMSRSQDLTCAKEP